MQTKTFNNIPLSVLDLAHVLEHSTPEHSFKHSVDLAQNVEKFGFNRYWLAEHHNMPGIASSATSVLIGHIAGATNDIRVGSGGVMLPNHASLVIAEQFGTLETLYPGRIDLGLGRAPGTDQATAYALRRTLNQRVEDFPMQVEELENYFAGTTAVRSVPGEGLNIPIWLLGSSGFSAQLSAQKGLPFSFASHFAPDNTIAALNLYRDNFQPSEVLDEPYAMIGVNIIAADTDEQAKYLATSQQQQFLSIRRGQPTKLQPPIDDIDAVWTETEKAAVQQSINSFSTIVGSQETVKQGLERLLTETEADEMIIASQIYDHQARVRSYEIVSELME
ncbi:luciferase family oxidoreductase, group 1 [Lentibacillus halodurans]|uniref:Luciferase family oxidoreductase, group 1 n=1 Tax=Lentibacillus halodurans TaxID=237679 RepID=A0A1I0X4M7_9BACI|nr:LLM class flavin-dependent oxidoreductase [Lentibacillus halodurans]SFA95992.1 luciferase family oxidoreductase, group 1 [Lentibacillus halodurans]